MLKMRWFGWRKEYICAKPRRRRQCLRAVRKPRIPAFCVFRYPKGGVFSPRKTHRGRKEKAVKDMEFEADEMPNHYGNNQIMLIASVESPNSERETFLERAQKSLVEFPEGERGVFG